LRGESTSGNLTALEGIRAGLVDVLAADYHPGALLYSVFQLAKQNIVPLHEAINLITYNPERTAGLDDRGRLEMGKRADIVILENGDRPRVRVTLRQGLPVFSDHVVGRLRAALTPSLEAVSINQISNQVPG
jgi:alpha-D-ribose 1-methylphosphonate 5-triphosphate diphosphatase